MSPSAAQATSGQLDEEKPVDQGPAVLNDALNSLSPPEYEYVCRVAAQIIEKTTPEDMTKIKVILANMTRESRDLASKRGMDPVTYFFRVQALNQLPRFKRSWIEMARKEEAQKVAESGAVNEETSVDGGGRITSSPVSSEAHGKQDTPTEQDDSMEGANTFDIPLPWANFQRYPLPPTPHFPPDTHPFLHSATVTDSGYASLRQKSTAGGIERLAWADPSNGHIATSSEAIRSERVGDSVFEDTEAADNDTRSIYSVMTNLGTSTIDGYVAVLAEELARMILLHEPTTDAMERIYNCLPHLLTALSLNIGAERSSRMHWEVMVFIHKYRR
jgi:hypothetical protein